VLQLSCSATALTLIMLAGACLFHRPGAADSALHHPLPSAPPGVLAIFAALVVAFRAVIVTCDGWYDRHLLRLWALKKASNDDNIVPKLEVAMRTTLALDDELVAKAQAFTGLKEKASLVREALKALIERESARRLARLGGSEPRLEAPPRRRPTRA